MSILHKEILKALSKFEPLAASVLRKIPVSPIFVVGCSHSGTSIMTAILGSHSKIYPVHLESRQFLIGTKIQILWNFLKWQAKCYLKGKRRWLEKTPRHIYRIEDMLDLFPRCRIVLMLRDGRDVACSLEARNGDFREGINAWIDSNDASEKYWKQPYVKLVKLEELVSKPEDVLRSILDFLGEEYEDLIEAYHSKPRFFYSSLIKKPPGGKDGEEHLMLRNWQINQPLFKTTKRWNTEMNQAKVDLFKQLAQDKLIKYGYETSDEWNV